MNGFARAALLAVIILGFGTGAGRAEPAAGPDYAGSRAALTDLLALVPDDAAARAGIPLIGYADFAAVIRATYPDHAPETVMGALQAEDLFPAFRRVNAGPADYVRNLHAITQGLPDAVGLSVFDVRRGLEFGRPPATGLVLGLDLQRDFSEDVAAALTARGFAARDLGGTTVWHRLEDAAIDPEAYDLADPFGGGRGQAARIAYIGGALAGSPVWPMAEAMVAAGAGTGPSLADDPAIGSAIAAVTDPAGGAQLLQLILAGAPDRMMPAPDLLGQAIEEGEMPDAASLNRPGPAGDLPPYLLVAIADRYDSDGERDEALVALVYPDRPTAEAAAPVLAERFRAFAPGRAPDAWRDMLADVGATIRPAVAPAEDGPYAAALVRIAYPARDGLVFRALVQHFRYRELTPLVVR